MSARSAKGQWLPGTSGNPRGRPKGLRTLTEDLHRVLGEPATADELDALYQALEIPPGLQSLIDFAADRQEAFARALAFRALTGHWQAIDEVFGRLDPKPRAIELSGRDGGPITGLQLGGGSSEDARDAYMAMVRGETPGGGDE